MTITVTQNQETVYQQQLKDSTTLNAVVSFLMQLPSGQAVITTVSNNGQSLSFNTAEFPLDVLVRKVNGIVVKTAKKKQEN